MIDELRHCTEPLFAGRASGHRYTSTVPSKVAHPQSATGCAVESLSSSSRVVLTSSFFDDLIQRNERGQFPRRNLKLRAGRSRRDRFDLSFQDQASFSKIQRLLVTTFKLFRMISAIRCLSVRGQNGRPENVTGATLTLNVRPCRTLRAACSHSPAQWR